MIHREEIQSILEKITYLDWKCVLRFRGDGESNPYLQWQFMAADTDNPGSEPTLQKSRKWMLSYYMIPQEIERTAYLALQQAVTHEMNESYRYKGVAIRHPHMNPDAIVESIFNNSNPHAAPALVHRPDNQG